MNERRKEEKKKEGSYLRQNSECQLVNVEGVREFENHRLTTIVVKINSGKESSWGEKPRVQNLRSRVFVRLYKRQSSTPPCQEIKINISREKQNIM